MFSSKGPEAMDSLSNINGLNRTVPVTIVVVAAVLTSTYYYDPKRIATICIFVISSIANRTPSRPNPL
jgi:hypothetical protein